MRGAGDERRDPVREQLVPVPVQEREILVSAPAMQEALDGDDTLRDPAVRLARRQHRCDEVPVLVHRDGQRPRAVRRHLQANHLRLHAGELRRRGDDDAHLREAGVCTQRVEPRERDRRQSIVELVAPRSRAAEERERLRH
jgi:hypothetical protein